MADGRTSAASGVLPGIEGLPPDGRHRSNGWRTVPYAICHESEGRYR